MDKKNKADKFGDRLDALGDAKQDVPTLVKFLLDEIVLEKEDHLETLNKYNAIKLENKQLNSDLINMNLASTNENKKGLTTEKLLKNQIEENDELRKENESLINSSLSLDDALKNAYKQNARIRSERKITLQEIDRLNSLVVKLYENLKDFNKLELLLLDHQETFKRAREVLDERAKSSWFSLFKDYMLAKEENDYLRNKYIDNEIEVSQYQYEDAKKHNEVQ